MGTNTFRSNNKVGETMSFQTNSPNTNSFDTEVRMDGSARPSWDLGGGSGYTASTSVSYTYPDSTIKTVTIRTNKLSNLGSLRAIDDNIVGHLDMSGWDNLWDPSIYTYLEFNVDGNSELTGVTHTSSPYKPYVYSVSNCDITGHLDLSMFPSLGGYIYLQGNSKLSGVTFPSQCFEIVDRFSVGNCDIQGNLDLTMFPNFGTYLWFNGNNSLTGITHTASTRDVYYYDSNPGILGTHDMTWCTLRGSFYMNDNPGLNYILHSPSVEGFGNYRVYNCDMLGNHDMSMLSALGGYFSIANNSNLTGITHTASSKTFTSYNIQNCNIIGNLNLPFSNFGGGFYCYSNNNLTTITHSPTSLDINFYLAQLCDLTGNHNMSMLSGLGGVLNIYSNPNLTGITHTASTNIFTSYIANNNNLTGTHNMSMLSGLGGKVKLHVNTNLNDVIFPLVGPTTVFKNDGASDISRAFALHSCDLGYINFLPLSAATMDVESINGASIGLEDNNMIASEVNHILVDLSGLSNTYSVSGWTGVTLDISGNNVGPDSLSGGYDGVGALMSLTGSPNNWNVTYSPFDTYSFFFDGPPGAEFITTADEGIYDLSTEVTLSVWVKPISGDPTTSGGIIDKFSTTGDDSGYSLWQSTASGGLWRGTFGIDEPVGGPKQAQVEFNVPNTNWQHLCVTFDSTTGDLILYHNGVAQDTESNEVGSTINLNNEDLIIGARTPAGGNDFGGYIDEISIWNISLNVTQINEIYNGGGSGKPGDLGGLTITQAGNGVGWYRMGDNASWDGSAWSMPNAFNPGTGDAISTDLLFTNRETETP